MDTLMASAITALQDEEVMLMKLRLIALDSLGEKGSKDLILGAS
jgi:hypothetical protein